MAVATNDLLSVLIDNKIKVKKRSKLWVVEIDKRELIAFYNQSKLLHYLHELAVQLHIKKAISRGSSVIEIGQLVALM